MKISLLSAATLIASTLAFSPQYASSNRPSRLQSPSLESRGTDLYPKGAESNGSHSYEELYKLQIKFLDAFIYPNNQVQAKAINSTLFARDVQGRVDITRTFDGRELNTEYIFGLFADLAGSGDFSLLGYPVSYEIVEFAASGSVASASTRFQFVFPALQKTVPVIINTYNVFNAAGEITMYDAVFKYWTYAFDTFLSLLASSPGGPATNATNTSPTALVPVLKKITQELAQSICTVHANHCNTKTTKQYDSKDQCLAFLTDPTKVRLGKSYELGMNTLLCRMVHQGMVPLRPEVHCPHIGPSGGGMCVDEGMSYGEVVLGSYFTNQPFVDVPQGMKKAGGNPSLVASAGPPVNTGGTMKR